jgi:hypothetical protein
MRIARSFLPWLPTLLAFPVGGLLAHRLVGPADEPLTAALAGALAGAVLGAAQWLALRSRGVGARWVALTSLATAVGSAVSVAATGGRTSVRDLVVTGLVSGTTVGLVQGAALARGRGTAVLWAGVLGVTWAAGWFVTASVIVDADAGYVVFGSSGALLVTVVTGLTLPAVLADRRPTTRSTVPTTVDAVTSR